MAHLLEQQASVSQCAEEAMKRGDASAILHTSVVTSMCWHGCYTVLLESASANVQRQGMMEQMLYRPVSFCIWMAPL